MNNWLSKKYAQLQIKFLVVFSPSRFFEKINQLDWYKNTLHKWIDDQNFPANSKVLEVGCATGALTTYIANTGCVPTGVDLSRDMIKLAKKNKSIEYLEADVMNLPFQDGSFDVVLATSLINIVDDKTQAINELTRSCKKGGTITILVPSEGFSDKDLLALQLSVKCSGFSSAAMKAWHDNPPKMEVGEIENLFNHAGLSEVKTKLYLQGMVISASAIKPF